MPSYRDLDDMLVQGPVSGQEIASRLGISRTAVFKHIDCLRRQGYVIESRKGKGYRLLPRFDGLLPLEVLSRTGSRIFGCQAITLASASSTQDCLRTLASEGAPHGTVVIAMEQSAGKGRIGRRWFSPRGGLWFSLLLRPRIPLRDICALPLLFGVSVSSALEPLLETSLKWPNDVLCCGGKKICGILTEVSAEPERLDYALVGIGVNSNFSTNDLPEDVRSRSASTLDVLGKKIDRAELLDRILLLSEELYKEAESRGFAGIIERWRSRSCMLGHEVTISSLNQTIAGRAVDINADGSLLVETEEGKVSVYCGDATVIA